MVGLAVLAVVGQGLSLRALAGFHEEKSQWEVREQKREELVVELENLKEETSQAKARTTAARVQKEQAEEDLAAALAESRCAR
jgi:hypothetical protein